MFISLQVGPHPQKGSNPPLREENFFVLIFFALGFACILCCEVIVFCLLVFGPWGHVIFLCPHRLHGGQTLNEMK
jgi:hypothetical protein